MYTCKSCSHQFKGSKGNANNYCTKACYYASLKGGKLSEETKKKIGKSFKETLAANPRVSGMKGKKWSVQQRQNIKKAVMGRTSEKRNQISERLSRAFAGRNVSEETKNKIRAARMNQKTANKISNVEVSLQKALESAGISFAIHKSVCGRTIPDLFISPNICVYVDGCYWHSCPTCAIPIDKSSRVGAYITGVVLPRDERVTMMLHNHNFKVIRLWEHEIKKDIASCVNKIQGVM